MNPTRPLTALCELAARRPRSVLACTLVLALLGAALALRLHPSAGADTFMSRSSATYKATQRFYRSFGEEPIELLVKGNLQRLLFSADIERLVGLEGCLAGKVPAKALAYEGGSAGPCAQLDRAGTVKSVLGPGTFINEAAGEIADQLAAQQAQAETQARQSQRVVYQAALAKHLSAAEAKRLGQEASKVTLQRFAESITRLALQYGLTGRPSLNDPNFVSALVFDNTKPAGTPKKRFAYLFPSRQAALVSIRLKAGVSQAQRQRTITLIQQALAMPQWRLTQGESYLLTGQPVIVSDLTSSITSSLKLLALAVLAVMALTLLLIFRGVPRLAPLAVALLALALTFGALSAAGAALTVGSVAVLPVLVGLAVDYAIQFQSRFHEAQAREPDVTAALRQAAAAGAPLIVTAGLASAAALLVLAISPVPMVRGFGLLLVLGIIIALLCVLSAGAATLVLAARAAGRARQLKARTARLAASPLAAAWRGARELLLENPLNRQITKTALSAARATPRRVLLIALILAVGGWALGTQTRVQTDIAKLVPQNTASLSNLRTLERLSGVGGELNLMISGRDLTTGTVIRWMQRYESSVLAHFGYSATRGCGEAEICPAFSLPDLFRGAQPTAARKGARRVTPSPAGPTQREVREVLGLIPPYFSQNVISADRRAATLAFGIRLMSLTEQQRVIDQLRSQLHPPKGISAQFVGLPVLAAASASAVASNSRRTVMLLAGLAAIALVLLAAFGGDRRRVLVPLVPVVLATGWSALILFATGVPLNPMSITLGALVSAVSTEFSVLLAERHRQERLAGRSVEEALLVSYSRTGAAVAASGVTAIAGFGVLVLSDISMLRDFGLVTLIDLSVSLIGVLLVLPSALTLAERREPEHPPDGVGQPLAQTRAALRRLRPRGRTRHETA